MTPWVLRTGIDRRTFIAGAIALSATPLAAEAQQPARRWKVGVLVATSFRGWVGSAVQAWLTEIGYVEGRDVVYDYRSAAGRDAELPKLAAQLVAGRVDVILTGGLPGIRAARGATATIPIVMLAEGDPVKDELVASLGRPGGNVTGVVLPNLSASGWSS